MRAAGLPHSEIRGSRPVDGSPQLIAVFRVLHSLLMPRHPSCARIRLAEFAAARPFASARRPRLPSAWPLMQLSAASPYEKGNRSCVLEFLPYEKFLALWRGSLPADLVYELQFSFNFQLPVFKDRTRLRSESFGKVKCLRYSLLAEP